MNKTSVYDTIYEAKPLLKMHVNPFNLYNVQKKEEKNMKWENLREEEFEGAIKRSGGLCVMVLGCLEKHGQHLPVGTDSLKGDKIVELATERADVMMFPTSMWLGDVSSAHIFENPVETKKHGFIGMNPQTMLTVLEELCDEIARNGFKKILLLSSHGGNTHILGFFVRSQLYKKKDYITLNAKAYDFVKDLSPANVLAMAKNDPEGFSMLTEEDYMTLERYAETGTGGGHADFRETCLLYGTHPDLVAPDRFEAEDGISNGKLSFPAEFGINTYASWLVNNPNAFDGYAPIGATPTLGKAYLKIAVDKLTRMLTLLKNDTSCLDAIEEIKTM